MLKSLIKQLNRPYPLQKSFTKKALTAALFGAFVFFFLFLFQPFGINNVGEALLLVSLGYGATTFVVMLVLNAGLLLLLPNFADENRWTFARELLWILLNILVITIANLLYSNSINIVEISWQGFLIFGGYTIGIGVFPTFFGLMISEMRLRSKFETDSIQLNREIEKHPVADENAKQMLVIDSENTKENLNLNHTDLLYIRAAENYIDVYFKANTKIEKRVLRNTLSATAEQLAEHKHLMRCHKSYLVNLCHVKSVSGNAQGYKLHLHHTEELIPVSRQHNQTLHQRLADTP